MDKDRINQLLKDNNATAVMIASALKVAKSSVYEVINKGKGSRRIAAAIAEICGKTTDEMFPYYKWKSEHRKEKTKRQAELSKQLAKYDRD